MRRPCLTCGVLTDGSYCPEHRPHRPRGRANIRLRARVFAAHGDAADSGCTTPLEVHYVGSDPTDNRIQD